MYSYVSQDPDRIDIPILRSIWVLTGFWKDLSQAQQVLQALLEKYADDGIENIENLDVLRLAPISTLGRPIEIFKLFGGKEKYLTALKDLETEIYRMAA